MQEVSKPVNRRDDAIHLSVSHVQTKHLYGVLYTFIDCKRSNLRGRHGHNDCPESHTRLPAISKSRIHQHCPTFRGLHLPDLGRAPHEVRLQSSSGSVSEDRNDRCSDGRKLQVQARLRAPPAVKMTMATTAATRLMMRLETWQPSGPYWSTGTRERGSDHSQHVGSNGFVWIPEHLHRRVRTWLDKPKMRGSGVDDIHSGSLGAGARLDKGE